MMNFRDDDDDEDDDFGDLGAMFQLLGGERRACRPWRAGPAASVVPVAWAVSFPPRPDASAGR